MSIRETNVTNLDATYHRTRWQDKRATRWLIKAADGLDVIARIAPHLSEHLQIKNNDISSMHSMRFN